METPHKRVSYCETCHSQISRKDAKQHKDHLIVSLKIAADEARKRLEKNIESVQLKSKACLDKIKEYEEKRPTTEDLHMVVDSEFDRICKALSDSLESVKKQRELQNKNFLQDLKITKFNLERNMKTIMTMQRRIASISDDDLLNEEGTFTKEIHDFQTYLQLPSFDVEEESVKNALTQAVYPEKEKKKTRKEHEQLQIEREYFENTFETVMTLLQSLVNYRENKEEKKENIKYFNLPKVPIEIEKSLRRKIKTKREFATDELQHLKNIVIELIDLERQIEAASSKKRTDEETTHESAKAENETQNDETMTEIQRLTSENEGMRNVIKAIEEWINICHNSVKQNEVDPSKLTLPSQQRLDESGMQILKSCRKKLEAIREHMKKLKSKMASTVNELEQKKEEDKVAGLERERTSSRLSKIAGSKLTDNNPGITDLSDPNRLTRLAEMFGEIHDNVWTDTIEGLIEKKRIKSEKEAVLHMASILKVCYIYCENKFEETLEQMEGIFLLKSQKKSGDVELDKEEQKQLKNMLKTMGVRTSKCLDQDDLIKCLTDRNLQKAMQKHQAVTKDFTKQCLEICWLMVIQDPPVVLYWGDSTVGSPIDADRFKAFTRSGDSLEYTVWPAVLLHTNGPLLNKGIVQPEELDTKP